MEPIGVLANKLHDEYPYAHEAFGMYGIIKLILWVLMATSVLGIK